METVLKKVEEMNEEKKAFDQRVREMNEELIVKMKSILVPVFKEFFDLHPEVKGVSWTQYTPYFNDGEPCEFGVHDFYYTLRDEDVRQVKEEMYHPDTSDGEWRTLGYEPESLLQFYEERNKQYNYADRILELKREIEDRKSLGIDFSSIIRDLKVISDISSDVYRTLGEGLVLVTPKGIDIMEYDHD